MVGVCAEISVALNRCQVSALAPEKTEKPRLGFSPSYAETSAGPVSEASEDGEMRKPWTE